MLTVAHDCYCKKCSWCDVSPDYIGRYNAATAETLVDRIQAIVAETGQTGVHFVFEAAPPNPTFRQPFFSHGRLPLTRRFGRSAPTPGVDTPTNN